MGNQKPIFALDLSNEGVALWHRKGSQGWAALGQVSLKDPEFERRLIELRDKAPVRGRAAVVRIPRSEVLLSRIRLGVFEGEAAANHARRQVGELTPYAMDEISYDLGDKGFGNMAPVGVVSRRTLREADQFARSHGFDPVYFTTQYSEREFDREPRFYLDGVKPAAAATGWMIPWVAAAAIGLTAGFLGYSWLSAPTSAVTTELPAPVAEDTTAETETVDVATAPADDPEPEADAVAETEVAAVLDTQSFVDALPNVAPTLPPVSVDLVLPPETEYPSLQTGINPRLDIPGQPNQVRLASLKSQTPYADILSSTEPTLGLVLATAYRDLPDVAVTAEIAKALQGSVDYHPTDPIYGTPASEELGGIQVARLTAPDAISSTSPLDKLPLTSESKAQVTGRVIATPEPPPRPVSLVNAEPGTLTPTAEGTLGPDNILIFAGRPNKAPPARPGSELAPPAPDPLAGKRPRLRPEGLVPAELLASLEPIEETPLTEGDLLLASADPELRVKPTLRPTGLVPETQEPVVSQDVAEATTLEDSTEVAALAAEALDGLPSVEEPSAVTATAVEDPVAPQAPAAATELAAVTQTQTPADNAAPDANTAQDPVAPAELAAIDPEETPSEADVADAEPVEELDLLALADPSLANKRALIRPASLAPEATQDPTGLLALADPSLRGATPRSRPADLTGAEQTIETGPESPGDVLLASADPSLRAARPTTRPTDLSVPEAFAAEVAVTQTAQEDTSLLALTEPTDSPEATATVEPSAQETTLLALADPSLAGVKAPARPASVTVETTSEEAPVEGVSELIESLEETPETVPEDTPTLLALADPTLAGKRARGRPSDLRATDAAPATGLLALADPSLRGSRSKARPRGLKVLEVAQPEEVEPEEATTNGLATATRRAIAKSPQPKVRPSKIARVAKRIEAAEARDEKDTRTSKSTTPSAARGTSKPTPGNTTTTVARAATEKSRFNKNKMSLVGVFGSASSRRALVRLPTGRYIKVKAGDRVRGWKVSAIGEGSLKITKGSRNQTLRVP